MGLIARSGSRWRHHRRATSAVLAVLALIALATGGTAGRAQAATLLSQGMPTTASSTESAAYPAADATDGNTSTRWSSWRRQWRSGSGTRSRRRPPSPG